MKSFLGGDARLNSPLTRGGAILLRERALRELGCMKKAQSPSFASSGCAPWCLRSHPRKPQDGLSASAERHRLFQPVPWKELRRQVQPVKLSFLAYVGCCQNLNVILMHFCVRESIFQSCRLHTLTLFM